MSSGSDARHPLILNSEAADVETQTSPSTDAHQTTEQKDVQQATAYPSDRSATELHPKADLNPTHHEDANESQTTIWRTGVWCRLPISAALSLFGVVACKQTLILGFSHE